MLGGRVKTLHPKVHAGILSKRKDKSHQKQLGKNNFENISVFRDNYNFSNFSAVAVFTQIYPLPNT